MRIGSVSRGVLRRALIGVGMLVASPAIFAQSDTDCWLTPDGCALDPARVPPIAEGAAARLAAALAEQVWCVTGTAAGAPFRAALAATFPGLSESLTT